MEISRFDRLPRHWGSRATRRTVLGASLAGLALTTLDRAPTGAQQDTPGGPVVGEVFVGRTEGKPTASAAVVLGVREARGYLCDGRTLSRWFTGQISPDGVRLTSEEGEALIGLRYTDHLAGQVQLVQGPVVPFTAVPATGAAGLYEVVVAEDGQITGTATDGRQLVGGVARELENGMRLVAALIEHPDGSGRAIAGIATPDAAGEQRWIVQADGTVVGGFKRGSGRGFMDGSVRITDGTSNTLW